MVIYHLQSDAESNPGVAQLGARLTGGQEAVSSSLATRTMQSVLIGSEYPVMDTLLFYVENGEAPEMSLLTRSRRHSSLTLCSVSRAAKLLGLPFQRKAIIVSDAAIEIGFHRVVPPIPQPVPGRS